MSSLRGYYFVLEFILPRAYARGYNNIAPSALRYANL
jgi:hypothetical protein